MCIYIVWCCCVLIHSGMPRYTFLSSPALVNTSRQRGHRSFLTCMCWCVCSQQECGLWWESSPMREYLVGNTHSVQLSFMFVFQMYMYDTQFSSTYSCALSIFCALKKLYATKIKYIHRSIICVCKLIVFFLYFYWFIFFLFCPCITYLLQAIFEKTVDLCVSKVSLS